MSDPQLIFSIQWNLIVQQIFQQFQVRMQSMGLTLSEVRQVKLKLEKLLLQPRDIQKNLMKKKMIMNKYEEKKKQKGKADARNILASLFKKTMKTQLNDNPEIALINPYTQEASTDKPLVRNEQTHHTPVEVENSLQKQIKTERKIEQKEQIKKPKKKFQNYRTTKKVEQMMKMKEKSTRNYKNQEITKKRGKNLMDKYAALDSRLENLRAQVKEEQKEKKSNKRNNDFYGKINYYRTHSPLIKLHKSLSLSKSRREKSVNKNQK